MRDSEIFSLRGEAHHPWHLYAGVVLLNEEGKLPLILDTENAYTFPRATMSTDESFVRVTHRLILEQIGVVPTIGEYLGSITTLYTRYDGTSIEKTVLYFDAHFMSTYGGNKNRGEERIWVTLNEAYDLLLKEAHGEEAIIDRVRAGKIASTP